MSIHVNNALLINFEGVIKDLESSVADLLVLESKYSTVDQNVIYDEFKQNVRKMCQFILEAENKGLGREVIKNILKPARDIYRQSPFAKRLQDWPNGYPGDYETVEYICNRVNFAKKDHISYLIEDYALNSPIAEQHRFKVDIQSKKILEVLNSDRQQATNILVIGCGSGYDLRLIKEQIKGKAYLLVLNDIDENALEFTKNRLSELDGKCIYKTGNIFRNVFLDISRIAKYDLILLGGVLDYIPEKLALMLLKRLWNLVNTNGQIIMTNINRPNPYRIWIEYLADWILIERDICALNNLIERSGIMNYTVKYTMDGTELTNIMELKKV